METNTNELITNVELPFFLGFYDTTIGEYLDFAVDEEIEIIKLEEGIEHEFDDYIIDYEGYRKRVVELFVEYFNDNYLPKWVKEATNCYLWSPQYYNFQNDEIVAELVLDKDWKTELQNFIDANKEFIIESVRKENTSRDGFFSYLPNDFEEWCKWLFEKKDGRIFAQILRWQLETEYKKEWIDFADEIEMGIIENLNDREFFYLKEESLAQ